MSHWVTLCSFSNTSCHGGNTNCSFHFSLNLSAARVANEKQIVGYELNNA